MRWRAVSLQGRVEGTLALALGLLFLGLVRASLAQSAPDMDVSAIAAREKAYQTDADTLVAAALARSRNAQVPAADLARAGEANLRTAPIAAAGTSSGPVDLDAMVTDARNSLETPRSGPMLVAFASLSIPEASLKRMIGDVTRAGGVVVFRGFPSGSPLRFAGAMQRLIAPQQAANVLIDPRLFRAFAIDAVPAYVVVSSDYTPCDTLACISPVPPFDRLSGNVTTRFALESFVAAQGPGAGVARAALARLEPSS